MSVFPYALHTKKIISCNKVCSQSDTKSPWETHSG